jgi:GDSL-like Lipase/Acylhydrolase family
MDRAAHRRRAAAAGVADQRRRQRSGRRPARRHDLEVRKGREAPAYLETDRYRRREKQIENGYRAILATIRGRWPKLPIIIHGYGYGRPLPDQDFAIPPRDGWTGKPMRDRGISDPALQLAIVEAMIDRFNDILKRLAAEVSDLRYVDVRNVVGDDWRDELHPNDAGFGASPAASGWRSKAFYGEEQTMSRQWNR